MGSGGTATRRNRQNAARRFWYSAAAAEKYASLSFPTAMSVTDCIFLSPVYTAHTGEISYRLAARTTQSCCGTIPACRNASRTLCIASSGRLFSLLR